MVNILDLILLRGDVFGIKIPRLCRTMRTFPSKQSIDALWFTTRIWCMPSTFLLHIGRDKNV